MVGDQGKSVFKRDISKLWGILRDVFQKEDEETQEFVIQKLVSW